MADWTEQAACAGDDPQRYILNEGRYFRASTETRQRVAQQLCRGCPVITECAADAQDHGDLGVVRGGVWLQPYGKWPNASSRRLLNAVATQEPPGGTTKYA